MSTQLSLSDYVDGMNAALERRRNLLKELETATPEQKPSIQSCIDSVEQEIKKFDGAIQANQPAH
jgi:hypothetical protein